MNKQQMIEEIEAKISNNIISINRVNKVLDDMEDIKFHCDMRYCDWGKCKEEIKKSIINHIPDKISLSRVLSALGHGYWYDFSNQMIMFMKDSFIDGIYWYLLKEDKSDAYLDDQSPETIEALHKLLVRK